METLETVQGKGITFPLVGFSIGNQDPEAPTLGLIGGVHGLERIGSEVVLAYLGSLLERLAWDVSSDGNSRRFEFFSYPW